LFGLFTIELALGLALFWFRFVDVVITVLFGTYFISYFLPFATITPFKVVFFLFLAF